MSLSSSHVPLRDLSPAFGRESPSAPLDKLPDPLLVAENTLELSNQSFKNTLLGKHGTSMSMELKDWVELNKV